MENFENDFGWMRNKRQFVLTYFRPTFVWDFISSWMISRIYQYLLTFQLKTFGCQLAVTYFRAINISWQVDWTFDLLHNCWLCSCSQQINYNNNPKIEIKQNILFLQVALVVTLPAKWVTPPVPFSWACLGYPQGVKVSAEGADQRPALRPL